MDIVLSIFFSNEGGNARSTWLSPCMCPTFLLFTRLNQTQPKELIDRRGKVSICNSCIRELWVRGDLVEIEKEKYEFKIDCSIS